MKEICDKCNGSGMPRCGPIDQGYCLACKGTGVFDLDASEAEDLHADFMRECARDEMLEKE